MWAVEQGKRSDDLNRRIPGILASIVVASAFLSWPGCVEFSHFGQINNRETSASVNGVTIEQQQDGGDWKVIGRTDGKGAWNIFKAKIQPGKRVRLSKPGYETMVMEESDFLSQNVIMLTPSNVSTFGGEYMR